MFSCAIGQRFGLDSRISHATLLRFSRFSVPTNRCHAQKRASTTPNAGPSARRGRRVTRRSQRCLRNQNLWPSSRRRPLRLLLMSSSTLIPNWSSHWCRRLPQRLPNSKDYSILSQEPIGHFVRATTFTRVEFL